MTQFLELSIDPYTKIIVTNARDKITLRRLQRTKKPYTTLYTVSDNEDHLSLTDLRYHFFREF